MIATATKKRLLVGCPLHQAPCSAFRRAVNRFMREEIAGWEVRWMELEGAGITIARNILASTALKGGYDVLLFLAGDIGFKDDDLAGELRRVLSHFERDPENVHVVSGLYLFKRQPLQLVLTQDEQREPDEFGLIEVASTGADLLALSVSGLEQVISQWPKISRALYGAVIPLAYESFIANDASSQGTHFNLFGQAVVNEAGRPVFLPEDYYWCCLAKLAGLKIHVDTRVRLQHWGQCCYDAALVAGIDKVLTIPNPKPHAVSSRN